MTLAKKFIGFVFGAVLSYIIFFMMITQMDISLNKAIVLTSLISLYLCFGLAYSKNVQCIILLILPQICSKQGRAMLIAYVFVITLSGPTGNIIENIGVLTASLSCSEEQLKIAFREIFQLIKEPLVAIKKIVSEMITNIRNALTKVRIILIRIKDLMTSIVKNIKKAFNFLGNIAYICNKKLGTPFQRCIDALEKGSNDCRAALGPMGILCKVTELIEPICYNLKILDFMCGIVDFVSDSIVDMVIKDLDDFIEEIHKMFYVSVSFTKFSFHFKTNSSKDLSQIKSEIVADIKAQAEFVFIFSYWMDMISGLMFLWTIWKVFRYKRKYLSNNRYDNKYLSKEFKRFDARRRDAQLETALPLKGKEKRLYIELTSWRLLRKERFRIARQAFFLFTSSIYVCVVMLTDYSLFWMLSTIRTVARMEGDIELPPFVTVKIDGEGIVVDIIKGIVEAMTPITRRYNIDPTPCLPSPSIPNTDRYAQITIFVILAWFLLILEPYVLRTRQTIMNHLYPEKANERAAWLCNQITKRRISFIKFARRKVRQRFRNDSMKNLSLGNFLRVKLNRFRIFRKILGEGKTCNLCGITSECLNKCKSANCVAEYCEDCYPRLNNTCPICMNPVEYQDFSDVSEILDSSLEESGDNENNNKKMIENCGDNYETLTKSSEEFICIEIYERNQTFCFKTLR